MHWIPATESKPEPYHTVVVWVVGGDSHFGEDYLDVGCWSERLNTWVHGGYDHDKWEFDDMVIEVSHRMDVPNPLKKPWD
jgi:hypothetical protein